MGTYRTIQGDTWDAIALRLWPDRGGEKLMHRLMEANGAYRHVVVFSAGAELRVPDVPIPVTDSLPPWRRRTT